MDTLGQRAPRGRLLSVQPLQTVPQPALLNLGRPGLDRGSRVPYYEQVKKVLLERIGSDDHRAGDLLPTEPEICAHFGVSRSVVRQALGDLAREGHVHRMRGKGTFVAHTKLRPEFINSTVGFFEDLTDQGHRVESQVLGCAVVPAADRVAEALELPPGTPCIELARLRTVSLRVIAFTTSYLPYFNSGFFEGLKATDLAHVSLYRALEERWGIRIHSGRRSLEAVAATKTLAGMLELDVGQPVLAIESVGRDASGVVVEHFRAWHRADRIRVEMDVVRAPRALPSSG
jgi:GntR family transcriptional regulator